MKAIGGTIAWLGWIAMLLGLLLFLLSLKDQSDLFIWSLLAVVIGAGGLVLATVG